MVAMLLAFVQVDMSDGTLAWLFLGCAITFLLSRKKGRTLATSFAWSLLSGGVAFFFGGVAQTALEKLTGARLHKAAGTFMVAALGAAWCPGLLKKVEDKVDSIE